MKKLLFLFLLITSNIYAQDSTVYRQVEEVTLKDGISQEEYEDFEAFWKTVKAKHIQEGKLMGWFLWKTDPKSNDNNPWADYVIINVFSSKAQMDEMMSKPGNWWVDDIQKAHKGKTKRSIIKKYTQHTSENKYRAKSVTYTNKDISSFVTEGVSEPEIGTMGNYIGMEQLNDDYVAFETKHFAPWHQKSGTRLYWELNEIVDRTDNAYKPVTHTVFEIINPENPKGNAANTTYSFAEEMATKYGLESRKMHGSMQVKLVNFSM